MHKGFLHYLAATGVLGPDQIDRMRLLQNPVQEPIGMLAFSHGMLTNAQVDLILEKQRSTGQLFGEIARDEGILTERTLSRLLEVQQLRLLWQTVELLVLARLGSTQDIVRSLGQFLIREEARLDAGVLR